uniref:Uncharacterized protein n=1 Tax=Anguilla anguilla TaxID=7936 RepID=A0A0E9WZW3_ANGAN
MDHKDISQDGSMPSLSTGGRHRGQDGKLHLISICVSTQHTVIILQAILSYPMQYIYQVHSIPH